MTDELLRLLFQPDLDEQFDPDMDEEYDVPYQDMDRDKPSLAVIACDGSGQGCVLYTAGPHLQLEIYENNLRALDELGLDDAPAGISIWEGKILYFKSGSPLEPDCGFEPDVKGAFREPTEEEWTAIRAKRCPWDDEDWRHRRSKSGS